MKTTNMLYETIGYTYPNAFENRL